MEQKKKLGRKILSVLFTLAMVIGLMPWMSMTAKAQTTLSGSGTENDPYRITSADDWDTLATSVNGGNDYSGKYLKLMGDITVSKMIGINNHASGSNPQTNQKSFSGTFNGDGHTLNLNIKDKDTHGAAPFSATKNATIKNLNVTGSVVGGIHSAGLVGVPNGTLTVENCTVSAAISGSTHHGGFVGHAFNATVNLKSCIFDGSLTGGTLGGMIGWSGLNASQRPTIEINNCLFSGTYTEASAFHPVGYTVNKDDPATINKFYTTKAASGTATKLKINGTINTAVALVQKDSEFTCYSTINDAVTGWNSAADGATLKLLTDVTTSSTINVTGTKALDLNGHEIKMTGSGSVISVGEGANLTLNDVDGNTGKITGGNAERGAGVRIDKGTFVMNGGTITGNTASVHGGAIYAIYGTFTMNGGEITGNNAGDKGAGVCVAGGGTVFTLNDGTISGNTASGNGGGVYVDDTFVMKGGSITGNISNGANGGGVYVNKIFTMENGTISGNKAKNGGGVYVDGSDRSFTMTGGTVSGNTAITYTGGVLVSGGATFTMSGGSISGNVGPHYGGIGTDGDATKVNISGKVTIQDNKLTNGDICNIKQNGSAKLNIVDALDSDASIGITMQTPGVFTNSTDVAFNDAGKFTSDNESYVVINNDAGQLELVVPGWTDDTSYTNAEQKYQITSAADSSYVLHGETSGSGDPPVQVTNDENAKNDPDKLWKIIQVSGTSRYHFVPTYSGNSNRILDAGGYGEGLGNGTTIGLWKGSDTTENATAVFRISQWTGVDGDAIRCVVEALNKQNFVVGVKGNTLENNKNVEIQTDSKELTQRWIITPVNVVTFDANGGSGTMDVQIVPNGVGTALNENGFTRGNYIFDGWNTQADGNGTKYTENEEVNISDDITLYAQWKKDPVASVTSKDETTYYDTLKDAIAAATNGSTVTLLKDVTETQTAYMNNNGTYGGDGNVIDGKTITITSSGSGDDRKTITGSRFDVKNDGNLTFKNIIIDGGVTSSANKVNGTPNSWSHYLMAASHGSTLTFDTGTLVKNYYASAHGVINAGGGRYGVYNASNNGSTINIKEGSVFQNLGANYGVFRADYKSIINMSGGLVTNCTSYQNEGVLAYVAQGSTFNMSGGKITSCAPGGVAPGVIFLHTNQTNGHNTFTMIGGTIEGNTAKLGGAVYSDNVNNVITIGGSTAIASGNTGTQIDNGQTGSSNIYLAAGQTMTIDSTHLSGTSNIGVYTKTVPTESADVKIASGASKDDIQYIHSDLSGNAGTIFCDGEKDWMYYNDTLYEITNTHHTHAAGTIWLTVTASIKAKAVTYNANGASGGNVPTDNTPYNIGDTVTVLGNAGSLTRDCYTFDGWNTKADGSGTTYAANAAFTITEDTTLYAQWMKDYAYLDAVWNATTKQVDYPEKSIGADKVTVVNATTTKWNSGWYAVTENVTISGRVTVGGDVKLILCNGATLTATNGISVDSGKKFTVYGQTNDTNLMGILNSRTQTTTGVASAGIGGSGKGKISGVITINGGKVSASGSREAGGAGIGGGFNASGGTTVINGGVVTVPTRKSVAGIGGGRHGSGGNITINGGTVNAGGYAGAAIGGAYQGSAGNITINGGTVTATDGTRGAAIGSGERKDNKTNAGTIRINGGTVVARNTAGSGSGGAGIGGGYGVPGGTIIITGGDVTATSVYGAGIGGGPNANGGKVTISGGTVTAYSSGGGVGIGKGKSGKNQGSLTIANDHVCLAGDSESAAGACFNYQSHRKKWVKIWQHIHSDITYGIEGNVLTAACTDDTDNCNLVDGKLTLTLTAPNKLYDAKVYDKAKTAWTSVNHNEWEEFSILTGTTSKSGGSIEYYQGETKLGGAPTEEGTYIAKLPIVLNSKNEYLEQEFMIIKPEAIFVTVPEVKELTYDGTGQELITAGVGRDGTIQYSLDDQNYSDEIPAATNAGDYTVWVYVKGDDLHNDSPKVSFDVTIKKKPAPILTDGQKPTANTAVPEGDDPDKETPLLNPPTEAAPDGYKIVYAIGKDDTNVPETGWSEDIPEGKDGTYYIWFKAVKDDNHEETKPENIKVTRIDYNVTLSPSTPTVGEPVTVAVTPKDDTVVYEWYTGDDSGEFTLIAGETGNTYTPTDADKGRTLKVVAKLGDKVIGEDIADLPVAETASETDKQIVEGEIYESDGTTKVVNAKITLKRGNTVVATTNTDDNGKYSFSVESGIYNVVSEYNGVTKTELVEITSSQDFDLTMPEKNTNSVLVVGNDAPDIMVGGLDVEAETVRAAQNGEPGTVTVTMTVEKKEDSTETSENINAIKQQASDKTLEFFETKLVKVVDNTTDNAVTETDNVLTIVVPYDFTGKDNVTVYRSYGETTEALSDKMPGTDGTFQIDNEAKTITIYTSRLATYAIGYNAINKESVETFNTEKEEQKTAADNLIKEDDSDESKALVEAAKKAIDELPYDYDKTLDKNKEALDEIINKLEKDLEKQRVLEKLTDTPADVKIDQGEPVINVDTEKIPEEYVEVVEEIAKKTTADIEDAVIKQAQEIVNKSDDVEDSDKNIVIIPSLEIDAKDYVISEDDAKLTLDIDAVYKSYETTDDITSAADTISAAASDDEADKEKVKEIGSGKIDTKGTPVNIRIELPEEFAQAIGATENSTNDSPETAYVKHSSNGINYEYNVKLYYDDDAYVAEFVDPNGFGTFTLSGTSESVVSVDGNNYTDLQSAIDDTEDGAVIKLINDNDVSASINTEKTITIDKDNHTGVVDIVVPPTLILTKTDNEDGTTTYKAVAKYTVTFDANGGTGTMAEQEIGGTAALNANTFTREGFVFDGWNTKADGKGTAYADKADITPTADMTLYAQWKENPKTEDKKEEDKSKDDKKADEPKTDDKKADEPKTDDKKEDEPKIDETLEASKKNAEDKINNVVAEVNKIVDSLTNITAEKKEELKKQNDTTIADAKNAVDSSIYVEAVEAAYQKAIESTKATLKDAIKTEVESQIVAAKKTIDNTKGLTNNQKKALKTEVDKEAKKVIDSLDSTVEKIVDNAAKGTTLDAASTKENTALVNKLMNKTAEIAKEAKSDAQVEVAANKYATPEKIRKNTLSINMKLKVEQVGKKIIIEWGKVKDADGYQVFVQYCGKDFSKKASKTIKKNSTTKLSVTKINGKKLNLKKNYKILVRAYKKAGGKKLNIGKSITAHIVGLKNNNYTNVKDIKITNHTIIYVGVGGTHKIKAKTILVDSSKKQLSDAHAKEFRYASADPEIAKVNAKGEVTGIKEGSTIIYVYARNGYTKEIKLIVVK